MSKKKLSENALLSLGLYVFGFTVLIMSLFGMVLSEENKVGFFLLSWIGLITLGFISWENINLISDIQNIMEDELEKEKKAKLNKELKNVKSK